ncbi:MAG: hypothetical protein HY791_02840 [Deltaproteobacteria bacterium]|nr:hypothetical protein [Deltaproteobacteria bacterium]
MTPIDLNGLIALAVNAHALLLCAGIFVLLRTLKSVRWLARSRVYKTLLPFLPGGLGVGAVFAGAVPSLVGLPWPLFVAEGLLCAWVAEKFYEGILGRMVLGNHPVFTEKRKEKSDE